MGIRRVMDLGVLLVMLGSIAGCGSSGGGGDNTIPASGVKHVVIPLEGAVSNVQVLAGQESQFTFTYHLPSNAKSIKSIEVDLAATLQHVSMSPGTLAKVLLNRFSSSVGLAESISAEMFARVASESADVCTSGQLYGPFVISSDMSQLTGVDTSTVSADASTITVINSGTMYICLTVFSPIDATFSVSDVEADVTQESCGSPTNFAGTWAGTYTCGNSCTGQPFGGAIQLTVEQKGNSWSYTDEDGATFTGSVCGDTFRFERLTDPEIERGVMTLDGGDSATKRSTWRTTSDPICGGDCVDILSRVPPI